MRLRLFLLCLACTPIIVAAQNVRIEFLPISYSCKYESWKQTETGVKLIIHSNSHYDSLILTQDSTTGLMLEKRPVNFVFGDISGTIPYAKVDQRSSFQFDHMPQFLQRFHLSQKIDFGSLDGEWLTLNSRGDTIALYTFKNGLKHGICYDAAFRYKSKVNGEIIKERGQTEFYFDGMLHGPSTYFRSDSSYEVIHYQYGKIQHSEEYVNDILHSSSIWIKEREQRTTWWEDGAIRSRLIRHDSIYEYRAFFPSGELEVQGYYADFQEQYPVHDWIWYDLSGRKVKSKFYEKEEQISEVMEEVMTFMMVPRIPELYGGVHNLAHTLMASVDFKKRMIGSKAVFKLQLDGAGNIRAITTDYYDPELSKILPDIRSILQRFHIKPYRVSGMPATGVVQINLFVQ